MRLRRVQEWPGELEDVKSHSMQYKEIMGMNEMQELMKPHFLYNTLEALEALILMDEKEKSAKLSRCLGQFYIN